MNSDLDADYESAREDEPAIPLPTQALRLQGDVWVFD